MKSYAQAGQDTWVHDLIGDSGFFVDVGAHDGIVHSNTYALEQAGWKGLCIEPNQQAHDDLRGNRATAYAHPFAASDHHGAAPFNGSRLLTGVQPNYDTVPVAPLSAILFDVDAPDTIHYLSIDVEGHELEVLAGMDFNRWHVRCATIEHNVYCDGPARKWAIAAIMDVNGFERVREDVVAEGYGPYEDWWVNRDG